MPAQFRIARQDRQEVLHAVNAERSNSYVAQTDDGDKSQAAQMKELAFQTEQPAQDAQWVDLEDARQTANGVHVQTRGYAIQEQPIALHVEINAD
jgi:tRNA A37 N6-isopentenylltransferase MiaA